MTEFQRATAVQALAPGRFTSAIDGGWGTPIGPNGGYVAALAVRALEAGINPTGKRRLRSVTLHYLRSPAIGPIELAVELVRSGRRFATGRLSATQDGKEVLAALATFGVSDLDGVMSWSYPMPDVLPAPAFDAGAQEPADYRPEDGLWVAPTEGPATLPQRLRLAPRLGHPPFAQVPVRNGGPLSGGWLTLAEPQSIDSAYVALIVDAWWPPAWEVLTEPATMATLDLTIHIRANIPPRGLPHQPLFGRYVSRAAVDGLIDEDGDVFMADGTLLAQSRQLALFTPFSP
jgi:acyl-CoA thioesterase